MKPEIFLDGRVTLWCGDCLKVMAKLPENSADSVVCDPPYHLHSITKRFAKTGRTDKTRTTSGPHQRTARGFMNKQWDGGDIAWRAETWEAVYRVLKPGGYLLAFGGTRTYGRLQVAIEDAGFTVYDMIAWVYGQGFPKSHNISKAIDRAAGAEREIVSEGDPVKRMIPGADQNKAGWEKNNGRVFVPTVTAPATDSAHQWEGFGTALKPALEPICLARKPIEGTIAANVLKWGTGALNIDGCRVGFASDRDRETAHDNALGPVERFKTTKAIYEGGKRNGGFADTHSPNGRWPANVIHDGSEEVLAAFPDQVSGGTPPSRPRDKTRDVYGHFDGQENPNGIGSTSGNASRFFYSAKADSDDRIGSKHPTVKPVDLMQYLVRLVTPPRGVCLDPFAGTGTTGEAAFYEGMRAVLIERESEYQDDIRRRMTLCLAGPEERAREAIKAKMKDKPADAGPLFGGT